jgi:hypothetical protein
MSKKDLNQLHDSTSAVTAVFSVSPMHTSRVKNVHFSMLSRPALGPTQPSIQWVPGALPPVAKRPGREADYSTPNSSGGQENLDLYIHSPMRLYGVVLN